MHTIRMTLTVRLVLDTLLNTTSDMYGLEICGATGIGSGTIYPILDRLEQAGWLSSRWEDIDPAEEGRPRRRYYRVTDHGRTAATARLASYPTTPRLIARHRNG